jgi:hypothetical protein
MGNLDWLAKFDVLPSNTYKMLTPKGQNLLLCQQKAFAFRLSWVDFKEHQDVDRLSKPPLVDEESWEQVQEAMSGYASVYIRMEESGLDALFCTEEELNDAFYKIAKRRLCSPDDTWKDIRSALFGIGREHSWEDGQKLDVFGSPLVDTRNPASGIPDISITFKADEATSRPKKKAKSWEWIPENIEPGNFVAVLAGQPDKYAMSLPNLNVKVWIVEAKVYNKKNSNLVGTFHYNKDLDVSKPLTDMVNDKVKIDERSVLAIYTVDIEEDFKLSAVNIREIEKYAKMT